MDAGTGGSLYPDMARDERKRSRSDSAVAESAEIARERSRVKNQDAGVRAMMDGFRRIRKGEEEKKIASGNRVNRQPRRRVKAFCHSCERESGIGSSCTCSVCEHERCALCVAGLADDGSACY